MLIGNNKYFMPLTLAPGAVGAYSLRRLRGDYTGPVINVRRSSDNTATDIGLFGRDLDTSALTTFTGAGDGFVTTWYDQSGNGRHVVQATAGTQPQIVTSGVVETESASPTLLFAGNQYLRFNYAVTYTVPTTAFGLLRNQSASTVTSFHSFNSFDSPNFHTVYMPSSVNFYAMFRGAALNSSVPRDTNAKIFTAVFNATSKLFINSAQVASGSAGSLSFSPLCIGAGLSSGTPTATWTGNISELVLYNSDMSTVRAAMESNINNLYMVY